MFVQVAERCCTLRAPDSSKRSEFRLRRRLEPAVAAHLLRRPQMTDREVSPHVPKNDARTRSLRRVWHPCSRRHTRCGPRAALALAAPSRSDPGPRGARRQRGRRAQPRSSCPRPTAAALDGRVAASARRHSTNMGQRGFFDHDSADGRRSGAGSSASTAAAASAAGRSARTSSGSRRRRSQRSPSCAPGSPRRATGPTSLAAVARRRCGRGQPAERTRGVRRLARHDRDRGLRHAEAVSPGTTRFTRTRESARRPDADHLHRASRRGRSGWAPTPFPSC